MIKIKTHKEFINRLQQQNPELWKNIYLISEYNPGSSKLWARTKFGLVLLSVKTLLKSRKFYINIQQAANKTQYWTNMAKNNQRQVLGYDKVYCSAMTEHSWITCSIHGDMFVPLATYKNVTCRKCARSKVALSRKPQVDHKKFLKNMLERNPKILQKVLFVEEFKGTHINLKAQTKYGEVSLPPARWYKINEIQRISATDPTNYWINEAEESRGKEVMYHKAHYTGREDPIILVCPAHGDFNTTPTDFLHRGRMCPDCIAEIASTYGSAWSRSNYVKRIAGKESSCYVIKCWDEEELFYKIGVSVDIRNRFAGKAMPYEYEVLKEFKGSAGFVWDKEHLLQGKHRLKNLSYTPVKNFAGYTECFSDILWDEVNKEN